MAARSPGPRRKKRASAREPTPATLGAELEARRDQRVFTTEQFGRGRTPLQVVEVTRHAAAVAEAAVAAAKARERPRAAPACRDGCAWCCYKLVGTAAPEVLRIAAYLRERLSADAWESLRERVREGEQQRRGLSTAQLRRRALPCPLLVEERCVAYPVRPLTCRGYNSSDAELCRRDLDPGARVEVPVYEPQQRMTTFVLDGLRAGTADSKLDGALLELTTALRVALEVPDAEERWLAGEAVFAPARLD
jgi:Fe-S-cluster containining protein